MSVPVDKKIEVIRGVQQPTHETILGLIIDGKDTIWLTLNAAAKLDHDLYIALQSCLAEKIPKERIDG